MPSYDYKCNSCNHEHEHKQSIKEDKIKICPNCGKETYERLISKNQTVQFIGNNWFKNGGKY